MSQEIAMKKLITMLLILFVLSSEAFGMPVVYVDSKTLVPLGEKKHLFSHGYITAIAEYMSFEGHACPPADVTSNQLHVLVMKYIEKNPRMLRYPALRTTSAALRNAFPCKKIQREMR